MVRALYCARVHAPQVAALSTQLKELQAKLDNREPRAEDTQLIESLRRQMKEKDEMVRRTFRGDVVLASTSKHCYISTPLPPALRYGARTRR